MMIGNLQGTYSDIDPIVALFDARNNIISSSICLKCDCHDAVLFLLDDAFDCLNQLQAWFIRKYPSRTPQL